MSASQVDETIWRDAWNQARPLPDTPGEVYLVEVRGVGLPRCDALRWHPAAPFSADGRWRTPALLARVDGPAGAMIGLQATALRADGRGKAAWKKSRHTFGHVAGGAVRLAPLEANDLAGALAVAEGVESALGFTALSGYPCWAALGANLAAFRPPSSVDELVIAADFDDAGLAFARDLAGRECRDRYVEIRHPTSPGEDWADVAVRDRHARRYS